MCGEKTTLRRCALYSSIHVPAFLLLFYLQPWFACNHSSVNQVPPTWFWATSWITEETCQEDAPGLYIMLSIYSWQYLVFFAFEIKPANSGAQGTLTAWVALYWPKQWAQVWLDQFMNFFMCFIAQYSCAMQAYSAFTDWEPRHCQSNIVRALLLDFNAMGCAAMQSSNLQNAMLNVTCSGGNLSEVETGPIALSLLSRFKNIFGCLAILPCIETFDLEI